jgi:GT2 family glycosyltransferase
MNDERVDEIVISDDHSSAEIYERLQQTFSKNEYSKVKLFRNDTNLGSFRNKVHCATLAKNDWMIVLDSDNVLDLDYLDSITNVGELDDSTIYVPEQLITFGRIDYSPFLDYRDLSGTTLDKIGFKNNITHSKWATIFNTGNYLVNRNRYLYAVSIEPTLLESYSVDALYINYLMFKNISDTKLHVLRSMRYRHRIHTGLDNEEPSLYERGYNVLNIENYIKNETSKW